MYLETKLNSVDRADAEKFSREILGYLTALLKGGKMKSATPG